MMIIFDPGGNEPTGVFKVVKELFRQDVKLDDVLMKEHSQSRKEVFKIQMVTSAGIQEVGDETDRVVSEINQQYAQSIRSGMKVIPTYFLLRYGFPEMDGVMRLVDRKASRKSVTIYIFDPRGELSCLHGVLLGDSTGIPKFQQLLQDFLKGKDLYTKGKISTGVESLVKMHRDTREQEAKKCKINHEDIVYFQGGRYVRNDLS